MIFLESISLKMQHRKQSSSPLSVVKPFPHSRRAGMPPAFWCQLVVAQQPEMGKPIFIPSPMRFSMFNHSRDQRTGRRPVVLWSAASLDSLRSVWSSPSPCWSARVSHDPEGTEDGARQGARQRARQGQVIFTAAKFCRYQWYLDTSASLRKSATLGKCYFSELQECPPSFRSTSLLCSRSSHLPQSFERLFLWFPPSTVRSGGTSPEPSLLRAIKRHWNNLELKHELIRGPLHDQNCSHVLSLQPKRH